MTTCERERSVLEAARSGAWTAELRAHAASCTACAETLAITEFLVFEAEQAAAEAVLPNAGLLWWKGQIAARRAAAERVTRPIVLMERAMWICCAVALPVILKLTWPANADLTSEFALAIVTLTAVLFAVFAAAAWRWSRATD